MKVLSLGLDKKILEPRSAVAHRALLLADKLDEYLVVVPGDGKEVVLSSKCRVIPSGVDNKLLSFLYIYNILNRLLKTNKYQLLTIQDNYFLAVLGVFLAKKYKIKVEVQNHGFEKLYWWRKFLAKWAFQRADVIRTVSKRLFGYLQSEFKINADKIYIVPVSIDIDALQKLPQNFDLHDKYPRKFIFLTVGRLVPVKNIAAQIIAISSLNDQDIVLLVVGDGPERISLEKLARRLGVIKQIIFVGWQDPMADYYRTSDCLLMTSFSEGFPLVPSEALVYNLPIIMTDVGSAGDLIEDNVNALVIPTNDIDALISAMTKIKIDEALRLKLKRGGLLTYSKIFSSQKSADFVYHAWQLLVGNKNL